MRTLDDIDLKGTTVLLRSDLNLSLDEGSPVPDLRFRTYMETLEEVTERGARTIVMAHQGRPGRDDFTSLKNHAELIADHIEEDVRFIDGFFGGEPAATLAAMDDGDIALMENVRMLSEELINQDPGAHAESFFVRQVAPAFDIHVNDAFSAAHRSHASLVGFTPALPSYAGPVMERELDNCATARDEVKNPVLVLGGEKAADLVKMLERMGDRADKIVLGGIPGEIALHLQGHDLGDKWDWIVENGFDESVGDFDDVLKRFRDKIVLPTDVVTDRGSVPVEDVRSNGMTWDIGTETIERYRAIIAEADSVLMKGPMGAYEKGHEDGTKAMLDAISASDGYTVLGGGHTSSLVERYGHTVDAFSHVSIAGGAFVRYMSGEDLVVVDALDQDG